MRDRFIGRFITAFVLLCIVHTNAYGLYIDSFMAFGYIYLDEDLVVTDSGGFNSTGIDIGKSIAILNSGVINSDFYITAPLRVYVKNSGIINGEFHVSSDARLIQVIESVDDITGINVDSSFRVLVHDASNISLTDVFSVATNADKIILDNSTLLLNDGKRYRTNSVEHSIEIIGDVILKLKSTDEINYSVPALRNVSGTGSVIFDVPDMDPLYKVVGIVDNSDLYMEIVRETDYVKIFKNDAGYFLNNLRRNFPDDKLLTALDNAPNIDSLTSVMSRSVRLRPIKLMEPVRRINMFDMLDGWRYSDASGVYSNADVVFSDTDFGYRANITITGDIANNVYAAINGYVGKIDVSDNINDFAAYMYGVNIITHYDDGAILGNLSIGLNHTDFDVGPVFDGTGAVNNPSGISGYMAMDIGANLLRKGSLTIAPFAGVLVHYMSVLDDKDIFVLPNFGIGANWSEHEFDILYDYGFRGSVLTDGTLYANAYVKFTAPFDDIGAELNFGCIHDDNGIGYRISVSANMLF